MYRIENIIISALHVQGREQEATMGSATTKYYIVIFYCLFYIKIYYKISLKKEKLTRSHLLRS